VTDADLAGIVDRDPTLAALAAVLDAGQRRFALGQESTVTRIRYKPGSSIVAALRMESPTGGGSTGWIAGYADPAKATKTLSRAARAGFTASAVAARPGVVTGETAADRMLSGPLAGIRATAPELFERAVLLRHNPHRRVVYRSELAGAPVALKVSAADDAGPAGASTERDRAFDALEHAGVSVLRPSALAGLSGVETVAWWGDGDLAGLPQRFAAVAAGRDLARLHGVTGPGVTGPGVTAPGAIGAYRHRTAQPDRRAEIAAAIRSITTVLPGEAARARAIGDRLASAVPEGSAHRVALVHGDFSPDQVLIGDGQVRLIDFDRSTLDAPERDLGSFVASAELMACPELGAALLEGYASAGGAVDEALLHRFTAVAFLLRAVEPFRGLTPDWAGLTRATLDRAESAAARC
jgi:hypothetical protein